eukprot:Hpha_TRINITY_DN9455_c0_g1::TRINITY_DN9455_c0_g1_i1::g.139078::m.139078
MSRREAESDFVGKDERVRLLRRQLAEAETERDAANKVLVEDLRPVPEPEGRVPVPQRSVLILGGSGYLGQFLTRDLIRDGHEVCVTSTSGTVRFDPMLFGSAVKQVRCDLREAGSCAEALAAGGKVDMVINCAAVSMPRECESDPATAAVVNSPAVFLGELARAAEKWGTKPVFVHLSTDQVYTGTSAFSRESDTGDRLQPLNTYGKTKLQGELDVQKLWPNHMILRSSIIYGPRAPGVNKRDLFLQFILETLAGTERRQFFDDEWRNPVYVRDISKVLSRALRHAPEYTHEARLFNCGGPERLSRYDMAVITARELKLSAGLVNVVPGSTAAVKRPMPSPADISMDSSLIERTFNLTLSRFGDALLDFDGYMGARVMLCQ